MAFGCFRAYRDFHRGEMNLTGLLASVRCLFEKFIYKCFGDCLGSYSNQNEIDRHEQLVANLNVRA